MMNANTIPISVTRAFDAPPATVYRAWLDPEIAKDFFFATPEGRIIRSDIDPRVGGKFVMTDRREAGDVEHEGVFQKLEEPTLIVFEFGIPADSPERTKVTIEINPLGAGSEITLLHEMSPTWADYKEKIRQGWTKMLDQLALAITSD